MLYLAQKPVGLAGLRRILEINADGVVGVITNTKPTGWWNSNEIYLLADRYSIPVLDNATSAIEVARFLRSVNATELLSVQHPNLISRELLDAVHGKAWNLHLSPLPSYRGWNGPSHAILESETTYGVSLHWVSEGLDEGEIAFSQAFEIGPSDTAKSVYDEASRYGISLISDLVKHIIDSREIPKLPQTGKPSYYKRHDLDPFKFVESGIDQANLARRARALYFPPFSSLQMVIGANQYSFLPNNDSIGIRRNQSDLA